MYLDPLYMMILIVTLALSGGVSLLVKTRFAAGQKVNISSGLTGADVAKAILMDAGITDVKVLMHQGFLSDHYNPLNKTLNLSKEVYYGRNASAAGVAAHEVGATFQFLRMGYFCKDKDSTDALPVFNRTVPLKDSWAKEAKK